MATKGEELHEEPNPADTIKEKCFQCIKGPANILMTFVVIMCLVASCIQVAKCIHKIFKPPISTFTHFDFNETLNYPAVTFCRDPPYKFNKLLDYGLYAHPQWTSMWSNFDFESVTLDDLWNRTTYDESEYFVQLGLGGERDNLKITPTTGFMTGRCHTVSPRVEMPTASKATGYSVLLGHSAEDVATSTSIYPPGYHVYIHSELEPFTEVTVPGIGLIDYLYVNIGEEIDIKLSVNSYQMLSSDVSPCSAERGYSASTCTSGHLWRQLGEAAGCSGPWMISDLPRCTNYSAMRNLIASYINLYGEYGRSVQVACPRRCASLLYHGYVVSRKSNTQWDPDSKSWRDGAADSAYQTQLYLFYNSMMVSVYEEKYNYDWSLFLADLGGSVGFLLGLSVIGAMKIGGKVWSMLVSPVIHPSKQKKLEQRNPSEASADTVQAHDIAYKKNDL